MLTPPVAKLPNLREIRRLLGKVGFDPAVNTEKLAVILSEYIGRGLSGRGVVNMLQEAAVKYGPVGKQASYEPLTDKFQDIIKALVKDKQVLGDALECLKGKTYM